MPLVVAFDDIKRDQLSRTNEQTSPGSTNTAFFRSSSNQADGPSAYLVQHVPGRSARAHYHVLDEFQIIVEGGGKFGRHHVAPYCVHFARAYTPYGPLAADPNTGWTFMVLRAHYDPGPEFFPAARDKLMRMADRRPWQVSKRICFSGAGPGINLQEVPEIRDDHGLFACALTMAPGTTTLAPAPSNGDGQFVVVVKGSLVYGDRELKALAVAFIKPEEDALAIHAGSAGLEALILNLPQVTPRAPAVKTPSIAAGSKKWQCVLCDFAYDEARGLPEDGIPPGTRWEDIPDSWNCPDCSASKSDFQMMEVLGAE